MLEAHDEGRWIALEYVDGNTIDHWSVGKPLKEQVELLARLAEGLSYLHARDVVHGDLKPSNVLVDRYMNPRLIDMGIAGLHQKVVTGGFRGTLGYAAPEQLRGKAVDTRTDIYSLGVIAYRLLTGRAPFHSENPASLAWLPLKTLPEPLSASRTRIPASVNDLVLDMLARTPQSRPDNATHVAWRLRRALSDAPREPTLGMDREREALRGMVVEALEGATAVAILHGPSGSGRSSLAREALRAAEREGLEIRDYLGEFGAHLPLEDEWVKPCAIALEQENPESMSIVTRVLSRQTPVLLLVRSLRPLTSLVHQGVRHLSPSPLSTRDVVGLLDFHGQAPREAEVLQRTTRGMPGAIVATLRRHTVPDDVTSTERRLLDATRDGGATVADLAHRLGCTEHDLLDLAEGLLDRGLLAETDDGISLFRPESAASVETP
jgi:serine/threonine protein kinase